MVSFRPARPQELPQQKELWQLAFGDSEAYINYFFDSCGPCAQSMVLARARGWDEPWPAMRIFISRKRGSTVR